MTVLWAALILAGLGIFFGVLLVIFGVIFHVHEDERIKDVEKMLPNYNCGACGYAGCHQMAEALVSGKEPMVSKCKPGKKDKNYDPIIAYLSAHPDQDGTLHVPKQ
jgi:electron transport complex protein RnfB